MRAAQCMPLWGMFSTAALCWICIIDSETSAFSWTAVVSTARRVHSDTWWRNWQVKVAPPNRRRELGLAPMRPVLTIETKIDSSSALSDFAVSALLGTSSDFFSVLFGLYLFCLLANYSNIIAFWFQQPGQCLRSLTEFLNHKSYCLSSGCNQSRHRRQHGQQPFPLSQCRSLKA